MKKVLIVDDVEVNHILLRCYFERFNRDIKLVSAYNGKEAIHKVRFCKDFDMILMDFKMPSMDGCKVMQGIREIWPEARIVLHSDYEYARFGYSRHGFDDILEKPLTKEAFTRFAEKYKLMVPVI